MAEGGGIKGVLPTQFHAENHCESINCYWRGFDYSEAIAPSKKQTLEIAPHVGDFFVAQAVQDFSGLQTVVEGLGVAQPLVAGELAGPDVPDVVHALLGGVVGGEGLLIALGVGEDLGIQHPVDGIVAGVVDELRDVLQGGLGVAGADGVAELVVEDEPLVAADGFEVAGEVGGTSVQPDGIEFVETCELLQLALLFVQQFPHLLVLAVGAKGRHGNHVAGLFGGTVDGHEDVEHGLGGDFVGQKGGDGVEEGILDDGFAVFESHQQVLELEVAVAVVGAQHHMVPSVLHVGCVEAEAAALLLDAAQVIAEAAVAVENLHARSDVEGGTFLLHRRLQRDRVNGMVEKIRLAVVHTLFGLFDEGGHSLFFLLLGQGGGLLSGLFLFACAAYQRHAQHTGYQ